MTILPDVHVVPIDRLTRVLSAADTSRTKTRLSKSKRQARDARRRKHLTTKKRLLRRRILIYKIRACFEKDSDFWKRAAPKAPNCLRSCPLSALPTARIFSICRSVPHLSSSSKHIARVCRNIKGKNLPSPILSHAYDSSPNSHHEAFREYPEEERQRGQE
jgi:hypothetical protein